MFFAEKKGETTVPLTFLISIILTSTGCAVSYGHSGL